MDYDKTDLNAPRKTYQDCKDQYFSKKKQTYNDMIYGMKQYK